MSIDISNVKLGAPPGSNTNHKITSGENISHPLQMVISKKTGLVTVIYAETSEEPCVLCEKQNGCDKSKLNSCHVFCG